MLALLRGAIGCAVVYRREGTALRSVCCGPTRHALAKLR